jgi:hypothetical protein
MNAEEIRALRLAVPFKPFVLVMLDQRRFLIDKPPYVAVSPLGNSIVVATGDDNFELLKPEWVKEAVLVDSGAAVRESMKESA